MVVSWSSGWGGLENYRVSVSADKNVLNIGWKTENTELCSLDGLSLKTREIFSTAKQHF